jgi:hypothetical protein
VGKTIADGYIELRIDDSKLDTETKAKVTKVTRDFGSKLNTQLRALNIDSIDLNADPTSARATIRDTERRLKEMARDAGTLDLQIKSEQAVAAIGRLRKQIGDLDDEPVVVEAEVSPAQRDIERIGRQLTALGVDAIPVNVDPREALQEIDRVQRQLREMSANATTAHVRIDADSAQSGLERLRKQIGDVGDDSAGGFVSKFGAKLGPLLAGLPMSGPLSVPVLAAAASAAPLLGAAIAGGIIGGVGIGGVIGGLTVAAKDSRVKSAVDGLGDRLEDRLESAGAAMVQPALDGLHDIELAVDTIDLNKIFAQAAKYVPQLAGGVGSAITDLGDGLEDLVANAGPVIGVISQGIASIGSSLGAGLSTLADNGPEATAALTTLFEVISSGIGTTLTLVNVLTELYGISEKIGGDFALQTFLKLTGSEMDNTGFSAQRFADATAGASGEMQIAADSAKVLAEKQKILKPVQDALAQSQQTLQHTLDSLNPRMTAAGKNADALRTAYQNLYGATQSQTDANEGFEASFDDLADAVKANAAEFKHNRDNLDLHTRAGRANRDALEDLLTKNNELYFADIAAGKSVDYARQQHVKRTEAVRQEAEKVHLNKGETDKLISTYGRIPGKKTTDVVLDGVKAVANALDKLYRLQRALALGININLVEGTGTVKDFKAAGGQISSGRIPGPASSTDNVLASTIYGDRIGLATGEFIVNANQTQKHLPLLEAINAGFDGYADGGLLARVDTSRRWPFAMNLANTEIMSRAQAESKIIPAVPKGATGPFIERVVRAAFPGLHAISTFRPGARTLTGNQSYHALNRAVDFPASRPLAEWVNLHYKSRTKELITPWNDLNIHNGARHTYTGAVWNQHNFAGGNAHDHWAMDNGGYLMPGWNPPIYNGTGMAEPVIPGPRVAEQTALLEQILAALGQSGRGPLIGQVTVHERQDADMLVNKMQFAIGGL